MSKINQSLFFAINMLTFNRGERVRLTGSEEDKIYIIKDMKKIRKGGVLYLLKSLEKDSVSRLYYEDRQSLLERIS
jgi:hypothetical protein